MGTSRSDIYEQLKSNLYLDDAVAGEAAGIAMGLVMLGTKSAGAIEDMVTVSTSMIMWRIHSLFGVGVPKNDQNVLKTYWEFEFE